MTANQSQKSNIGQQYIAWMNGTSVKRGTLLECEAHARRIFNTPAWRDTHIGRETVLRITWGARQTLVSETIMHD
jgi:hypothetical protein